MSCQRRCFCSLSILLARRRESMTIDSIERLSRGGWTIGKVGSRAIPHRLRNEERILFEKAKTKGFVVLPPPQRGLRWANVRNCYVDYCSAVNFPAIVIQQTGSPSFEDSLWLFLYTIPLKERPRVGDVVENALKELMVRIPDFKSRAVQSLAEQVALLRQSNGQRPQGLLIDDPQSSRRVHATMAKAMEGRNEVGIMHASGFASAEAKELAKSIVSRIRTTAKEEAWQFACDRAVWHGP